MPKQLWFAMLMIYRSGRIFRVLLLDDDTTSAVEIRSKLEEMDYIG